jgi:endonuclease-3 related protein
VDRSRRITLRNIYRRLYAANGRQHWWPGDSRFEIMVGAVLTQNIAWTNVVRAIANLKRARALTPEAIVAAPHRRLAAWLRPSGYFNRYAPWRAKRWRVVRGRRVATGEAGATSRRRAIVGERFACAGSARGSTAGRPRPGRAERDPGSLRRL